MSSRSNKERQLSKNIELSTARAARMIHQDTGSEAPPEKVEEIRSQLNHAAQSVDKKLPQLWNSESTGNDDFHRPEFGFFGGVNFDANGKIIR